MWAGYFFALARSHQGFFASLYTAIRGRVPCFILSLCYPTRGRKTAYIRLV